MRAALLAWARTCRLRVTVRHCDAGPTCDAHHDETAVVRFASKMDYEQFLVQAR